MSQAQSTLPVPPQSLQLLQQLAVQGVRQARRQQQLVLLRAWQSRGRR